MFKDVNEAMAVLGDRDKREKYDSGFDLEEIN
jgi:curved DNA-binding protein CbpA